MKRIVNTEHISVQAIRKVLITKQQKPRQSISWKISGKEFVKGTCHARRCVMIYLIPGHSSKQADCLDSLSR